MQPDLSGVSSNYFRTVSANFSNNLSSSITASATTVPVNSTSPYSDGQYVVCTVEPGTASQATFCGQVSGNSFINCVWTEGNLVADHNSGKTVVDYDSATHYALLVKGLLVEHTASGAHGNIAPSAISVGGQTWATLSTGWLESGETWSYANATTFTISGDKTAKYLCGTKIRLIQSSTTKYFNVLKSSVASATTTVTIIPSTDYTLTNATISSPVYSYAEAPAGWPLQFNYTSTLTNLSGGTQNIASFNIKGIYCFFNFRYTLGGAGVAGGVDITLPTASGSAVDSNTVIGDAMLVDAGTAKYFGYCTGNTTSTKATIVATGTNDVLTALSATVPHTWAATDIIDVRGRYLVNNL